MAANLLITIPLAWVLNTWIDEAYTLHTTGSSLGYAIHQAIHFEEQPPLYFAILDLWRGLDHSVFFARLFSVICAALIIYCVAQLSIRYVRPINPMWAVVAVAFNPAIVWAAEEIRVYAFAGLLGSLLLLTFYDGYLSDHRSKAARAWYSLIAIASLYTHYFLGFLLLGAALALTVDRRFPALKSYLLNMVPVVLAAIPIAFFLRVQLLQSTALFVGTKTMKELLYALDTILFHFVVPAFAPGHVLALSIAAVIGCLIFGRSSVLRSERTSLWTITLTCALCLVTVVFLAKEPSFGQRYVFIFFIPFMLAILAQLASLKGNQRVILMGWMAILLVGSIATLYTTYRPLAKPGDWRRVAAYIMSAERPGQPILAFVSENELTLNVYYRGLNRIAAIPNPTDFDDVDSTRVLLKNDGQLRAAIARLGHPPIELWVVTTDLCHEQNIDYHCEIFERFISTRYVIVTTKDFYRSTVRLVRARSERADHSASRITGQHRF
jgi:hypothetical protein